MPGRPRGQHDLPDRAGPARAEREARLAQVVRHELQHLFGRADHDRQHQAAEGERTGEARHTVHTEAHHPDRVDEQAHDDRGHTGHHVCEEAQHLGQLPGLAVLVQVDGAEDPERDRHRRGREP